MACHLRQASGAGGTELYAIRGGGCMTQFTHGKVFHRQKTRQGGRVCGANRWGTAPKRKSLACNNKTRVGCSGSNNLSAVDPICGWQHPAPGNQPRRGPQLFGGEYARPKPMKDTRNYGKRHPRFRFLGKWVTKNR